MIVDTCMCMEFYAWAHFDTDFGEGHRTQLQTTCTLLQPCACPDISMNMHSAVVAHREFWLLRQASPSGSVARRMSACISRVA